MIAKSHTLYVKTLFLELRAEDFSFCSHNASAPKTHMDAARQSELMAKLESHWRLGNQKNLLQVF